jgi:RND family efflux transporter MFP subunit
LNKFPWLTASTLAIITLLSACNRSAAPSTHPAIANETLLIAPEDSITLHSSTFAFGPTITGAVQPEKKADLRAEVASVVLQVLKENGDQVKQGDLLVRLDNTSISDNLHSAQETERAALQALSQAERQLERLKTLRSSGMASAQQLEDAQISCNNKQSDLSAAKASVAQARQQLQRTEIRAPFNGVISERKVSNGDTAQIGKELIKVIDPSSMRFEGLIAADRVSQVNVGQAVSFHINGYPNQTFHGVIKRINPQVDLITRQVEVLVSLTDNALPLISGLYAEGQIEANNAAVLMIPDKAVVRHGDKTFAWTIKANAIHKVAIALGQRNPRNGDYVVKNGLADGDVALLNPTSTLKEGSRVQMIDHRLQK